jgi:pimeloyl-ACP methyl ester carboxylesterase
MDQTPYLEAEQRLWQHYGLRPSERFVELPAYGTRMRVQEFGAGEPLLLVHGGPTSGAGFASLLPHLDGVRCLVVDRPGSGLSETPAWTRPLLHRSLDHLVADMLDGLGLERAHVLGSSFGGTFALRAATATPERIERLVLLGGPTAIEGLPLPTMERLLLAPGVARLASRFVPSRKGQRKAIADIGHQTTVADGRIPDVYWDWNDRLLHDTGAWRDDLGSMRFLAHWSMTYGAEVRISADDLAQVQAPTLVVWGGHEPYGGRESADLVTDALPDARLAYLPDAGHLPWLDEPEVVGRAISEFLAGDAGEMEAAA